MVLAARHNWMQCNIIHKYKLENKELRTQIAILAKKLATETLDPLTLEAYVSCQLIPLDKNPGFRPTGVGEVLGIMR